MEVIMKKWSVYLIGLSLTLFTSTTLFSQEWSDAQKEVWETVKTYNNMFDKGDVQGLLSYNDESFSGWSYSLEAPRDKNSSIKVMNYWLANSKTLYSTMTPAKIWVNGDYAYVHYYYTEYSEDAEGKKKWRKGRYTDILLKKDGKWMIVGDHGGAISK
jgi:ketosteroid isomerase-like protein